MSKVKKIFTYVLWLIGFFILSEILINVSLNSSYKPIGRKDSTPNINVYQAEATKVNGRIRGIVTNTGTPDIQGKYIKIDIYSPRDVKLGTKYIDLSNLKTGETDSFEVFYKLQDTSYYNVSIVDEMEEVDDKPFFSQDFVRNKIVYWVVLAMILW